MAADWPLCHSLQVVYISGVGGGGVLKVDGVEILDPKHWNSLIPLEWEPARTPAFYLLDKLRRLGRPDC